MKKILFIINFAVLTSMCGKGGMPTNPFDGCQGNVSCQATLNTLQGYTSCTTSKSASQSSCCNSIAGAANVGNPFAANLSYQTCLDPQYNPFDACNGNISCQANLPNLFYSLYSKYYTYCATSKTESPSSCCNSIAKASAQVNNYNPAETNGIYNACLEEVNSATSNNYQCTLPNQSAYNSCADACSKCPNFDSTQVSVCQAGCCSSWGNTPQGTEFKNPQICDIQAINTYSNAIDTSVSTPDNAKAATFCVNNQGEPKCSYDDCQTWYYNGGTCPGGFIGGWDSWIAGTNTNAWNCGTCCLNFGSATCATY